MNTPDTEMMKLAERLDGCADLSLLHKIPVPCPGGYTYLQRDDLKKAAAILKSRISGDGL